MVPLADQVRLLMTEQGDFDITDEQIERAGQILALALQGIEVSQAAALHYFIA